MSTLRPTISARYSVTFNYDRPYDELIGVNPKKFDMVSNCFIPEHFPIDGNGIVSSRLRYFEFSQFVETNEEVLEQMNGYNFLPAHTVHVAQFGIAYPELQLERPYIGLGSSWKAVDGNGHDFHPVLDRWTLRSYFGIVSQQEGGWKKGCRFLALELE